jgi:hypothetical protein
VRDIAARKEFPDSPLFPALMDSIGDRLYSRHVFSVTKSYLRSVCE